MPNLAPVNLLELCKALDIDINHADPNRDCPICSRQGRSSTWLASKAVAEVHDNGDHEYSIRLECSNALCLFTTLKRKVVPAEPAPAPTIEEV